MDVELYTFPGSNAGLTVELLLQHVGLDYREHRLRPGLHTLSLKARRFPTISVPAAVIDGEQVQGTRRIAHVIADALPDSGLLPKDPERREQVLDAEHQGERLQIAARRLVYALAHDDHSLIRPLVDANYGFVPRPLRGAVTSGLIAAAAKGHKATPARAGRELDKAVELIDWFDDLVEAEVLGTGTPTIADFQIAPNLALLALATNVEMVLRKRPSWQIAAHVLDRYPLDVSAEAPADWAQRLRRDP